MYVTCHHHSNNCFIAMPLIHLDCCITVYCHNTCMSAISPDCFWKPIKLLRTHHPVDAEISDGLANYR